MKYKRVTLEARCQISALLQAEFSKAEIARRLNYHKSTISREIKRSSYSGLYRNIYNPSIAHRNARKRFESCRRKLIIKGDLENCVVRLLQIRWSPNLISGRLRHEGKASVSHETIYRYIRKFPIYRSHLRWASRRGGGGRLCQRVKKPIWHKSIKKRPKAANKRLRIGDWERDGMFGANRKQLLVCTDRKTRFTKLAKMPSIYPEEVNKLTIKLLKTTKKKIHTITNDNGTEFRAQIKNKIPVYYCTPYKPQQRGTVENTIGILRQFVQRKTDLDNLTEKDIKEIEDKINFRPRKILNYKTPFEVFFKQKVALAM